MLITHNPEDVAALTGTLVVFDTGRVRRIVPLENEDKQKAAAGFVRHFAV
jgi:ABC-type thiamine transport system ATPase subunit